MLDSPLYVLTLLTLSVLICEWLVRNTFLRHLGTALLVILFVAVLANVGLLPSASEGSVILHGSLSILGSLIDFLPAAERQSGEYSPCRGTDADLVFYR